MQLLTSSFSSLSRVAGARKLSSRCRGFAYHLGEIADPEDVITLQPHERKKLALIALHALLGDIAESKHLRELEENLTRKLNANKERATKVRASAEDGDE